MPMTEETITAMYQTGIDQNEALFHRLVDRFHGLPTDDLKQYVDYIEKLRQIFSVADLPSPDGQQTVARSAATIGCDVLIKNVIEIIRERQKESESEPGEEVI